MPIAMLVDNPEGTHELYDKVRGQLAWKPLKAAFPRRPSAGQSEQRLACYEVWESEGEANRFFKERLEAALRAAGPHRPTSSAAVLAGAQLDEVVRG